MMNLWLQRQEIVLAHQPRHALVVHQHSAAAQLFAHAPVAVAPLVLGKDRLDRRPHGHVLCNRIALLQRSVESCAAHAC